jgi:hypothetical protein
MTLPIKYIIDLITAGGGHHLISIRSMIQIEFLLHISPHVSSRVNKFILLKIQFMAIITLAWNMAQLRKNANIKRLFSISD